MLYLNKIWPGEPSAIESSVEELKTSLTKIWKKDPSESQLGFETLCMVGGIQNGPQTADINIVGMPAEVTGDKNGNFLFEPSDHKNFDACHTLAVVQMVLDMYRRSMARLGDVKPLNWEWGDDPKISVHPHAGVLENAYYDRQKKEIKFFYFTAESGETIYTCRALDVVAHETGHAVLDSIKPGFMESWNPQTGGFHEAFGDITAIHLMFTNSEICHDVIVKSRLDLNNKNAFFTEMGEQFGLAIGMKHGLRNADNDLKMSDIQGNEVHALSQVFTGAYYNILAAVFPGEFRANMKTETPEQTLYRVTDELRAVLIQAVINAPAKNASYADLAEGMIKAASKPAWKEEIQNEFNAREILGDKLKLVAASEIKEINLEHCSGTLNNEIYKAAWKKAHEAAVLEETVDAKKGSYFSWN